MIERKIDNPVVSRIAKKIRATRLEKRLTIQQLATRMQVSKGLLSKIENSRTIPSLPVFMTLIESLDISLKEFFDDLVLFNGKGYLVVKRDAHMESESSIGYSTSRILIQHVSGTMETSLINIKTGNRVTPVAKGGFVFTYILNGSCEYEINDDVVRMEAGDTIYFENTGTHLITNKTGNNVSLLEIHFSTRK